MKTELENKKSRLSLKEVSKSNVPFEIRSLNKIKEVGNYAWTAEKITAEMNFPDCTGESDECICCEGQLFILRHGTEGTNQTTDSFGQVLTMINHETNRTNIFTRSMSSSNDGDEWSPWQMVATGDPKLINENNCINEILTRLRQQIETEQARSLTADASLISGTTVCFHNIVESPLIINAGIADMVEKITYYKPSNIFVAYDGSSYWDTWNGMDAYMIDGAIRKDKVYLCGEQIYTWNGHSLSATFPKWSKLATFAHLLWADKNLQFAPIETKVAYKQQGKYLNERGEIKDTSNSAYYLYHIEVSEGDIYKISAHTSPTENTVVAAYSQGECVDIIKGYNEFLNYIFIPSGIDTLYFQSGKGDVGEVVKCIIAPTYKSFVETTKEADRAGKSIANNILTMNYSSLAECETTPAGNAVKQSYGYLDANGFVKTADTDFFTLYNIEVSEHVGRVLCIKSKTLDKNAHYSFFDSDGNIVATINKDSATGYNEYTDYAFVPFNAKKLSVAGLSNYTASADIVIGVKPIGQNANIKCASETIDAIVKGIATPIYADTVVMETVENTFINKDGEIKAGGGNSFTTSTVDVSGISGKIVEVKGTTLGQNCHYVFIDNAGKLIYKLNDYDESGYTINCDFAIVPYNAKRLVVSGLTTLQNSEVRVVKALAQRPQMKWRGLKWACIGDSLTESNLRATMNYHDYVAEDTGIEVVNMGKSGTGYKRTEDEGKAFYQRIASIPTDVDVVTIFGSGNDLNTLVIPVEKLGAATDNGTDTIGGCINKTLDTLYSILPFAVVGIVSPTPWVNAEPKDNNVHWENYVQLLSDICSMRGIPFLDLYHCSGLRPDDETFRTLAYSRDEGNGVHPDENGHRLIAPRFKNFLSKLIF